MRSVLSLAVLALLAFSAFGAGVATPKATTSPWKIIEAWTKQMPGGNAMQINPVYDALNSIYFTTSANGTVYALNTTTKEIAWSNQWDDITFIQAIPQHGTVLIGRSAGTDCVTAATGEVVWSNSSIIIVPDLSNHGDRNFILFETAIGVILVYREISGSGYAHVCALDAALGVGIWCDTYRTTGLPDAAFNNTLTAPLFDASGQQYAVNYDVLSGNKNFLIPVDTVLTGNAAYIAVANGTNLLALDSMTGNVSAQYNLGYSFQAPPGTSTIVHSRILAVSDGKNWIAAMDCTNGNIMWNVSTPVQRGQMQLQHRGNGVLVLAVLTGKSTNFTRFDAYEGNFMWTVSARPTGTSLAPVHAWLGNDIIYCRDVTNTWSAYGVDTGNLISHGSGDLFLPRSVAANVYEPHVGYFVTGPEGIVYALKIVPRNQTWGKTT